MCPSWSLKLWHIRRRLLRAALRPPSYWAALRAPPQRFHLRQTHLSRSQRLCCAFGFGCRCSSPLCGIRRRVRSVQCRLILSTCRHQILTRRAKPCGWTAPLCAGLDACCGYARRAILTGRVWAMNAQGWAWPYANIENIWYGVRDIRVCGSMVSDGAALLWCCGQYFAACCKVMRRASCGRVFARRACRQIRRGSGSWLLPVYYPLTAALADPIRLRNYHLSCKLRRA